MNSCNIEKSHAYLICGASADALFDYAATLITQLEEIENENAPKQLISRLVNGIHPDIKIIEKENNTVKIDALRLIYDFILIKPDEYNRKYVIIQGADNIAETAQNALLKVLEDPPTDCAIILTAGSAEAFLPTVLSRVVVINIAQTSDFGVGSTEAHYLREALCEIILYRNIEKLFDTAKKLCAENDALKAYIYEMYAYFTDMQAERLKNDDPFVMMCENGLSYFSGKCMEIITDTLSDLQNNASALMLIESMFIRMLEEYNAKDSGNQI